MITPNALPGWYPDPTGVPGHRYHDGQVWTAHFTPAPQQPLQQPAERRFTIHYGFTLLAILSLFGTVIPTMIMLVVAFDTPPNHPGDDGGVGLAMALMWLGWGGIWTLIWTAFAIQHTLKGRRG